MCSMHGKSMQGGAVSACISVRVTVDFCCTVPFLSSMATMVSDSLSFSRAHIHTYPLLCWERHKSDFQQCSYSLALPPSLSPSLHSHVKICVWPASAVSASQDFAPAIKTLLLLNHLQRESQTVSILCCSLISLSKRSINICNAIACC